ncbi:extracellular solute-binding protein [Nonomuraea sp. NPDC050556]|uniref:ABC transporter substrate-binding protein n=1 Tax=Nonomuraea sp. NPDC050556 TaxID=3364369 RepID=UPI0037B90BC1
MRLMAPVLTASLLVLGVAACGSGSTGTTAAPKPAEKVTLTIGLFGDFGFKPLYDEYKKTHPNVEIVERVTQFNDHHNNLIKRLATNAGAADIEAVEVGYISTFTAQPQKFHNLKDYGLDKRQGDYLDWKWQQGLGKDGQSVLGLGTDVGGLAMCYRKDIFKKAGLPDDRAAVGALWPTWEQYIETGKKFAAANVAGSKFVDSPGEIFRAMVNQAPTGLYDAQDQIIVGTNPDVKKAWDLSNQITQNGLSAKLAAFSPPWNTGFAKGSFATIICPAWMTGFIQEQAKDATGKWDIATVPGGSGNSGGSHLMLPQQGKHPKEAAELIDFLTSKENQAKVFKEEGTFPSIPALYDDPSIQSFTKPFFGDAPIGKIYSEAAKALKPQHLGPKEADVRVAIGNGLGRVEQGKQTPDEAWTQVLADVAKIK